MKIVYMGTPDFAVEPLEAIIKAGHEVVAVVTQPDRVKGRGQEVSQSPVKECALKYNLKVLQPEKIRKSEWVSELAKLEADIFVVAAFGQILSKEILMMPRFGCINIHASLLPKYRGAAPIQWCILNGEEYTGVTIQQMAEGVDTGDILLKESIPIEDKDTGNSLFDKLMHLGADMIVRVLPMIENGSVTHVPQNEDEATHVGKISKDLGLVNWSDEAEKIERYVRGLNSWPSAYTVLNGKTLKIWESEVENIENESVSVLVPGTVAQIDSESFTVICGKGFLKIKQVQLEGKKRMNVHDFLLGYHIEEGTKLG